MIEIQKFYQVEESTFGGFNIIDIETGKWFAWKTDDIATEILAKMMSTTSEQNEIVNKNV